MKLGEFMNNSRQKADEGIVYVLKMIVGPRDEQKLVYKVGITTRSIEDRVAEIARSHFQVYRYFPQIDPRKFSKAEEYFAIEAWMHRKLKDKKYTSCEKFDGHNELFDVDEDELLELYCKVMDKPSEYLSKG